jgi:hypothetical protein
MKSNDCDEICERYEKRMEYTWIKRIMSKNGYYLSVNYRMQYASYVAKLAYLTRC